MTNLTEQWKKGELKKGKKYWCKLQDGTSEICYLWLQTNHFTFLTGYQSRCLPDEDIAEVLAPVPSYEEWKTAYESQLMESELLLTLKGLLKECRDVMNMAGYVFAKIENVEKARKLLTKIDEVLK